VGLYIVLRLEAVPEIWRVPAAGLPFSEWLGTRLAVLGETFVQLVYPLKPGLSDATRVRGLASVPALATAIGLIGSLAILRHVGLRSPWARVISFLAIALAPALNIVPLARFSSPHYAYFAVVGVGAAVALAFRYVGRPPPVRRIAAAAVLVWMLAMAGSTFAGGFRFRNDLTLFAPEVERDPFFREGHQYLGDYFFRMEDYASAVREYRAALQSQPGILAYVDRHTVLINLAGVYLAENRLDEADELLRAAAADARPNQLPQILYNRALIAYRRGDFPAVAELLGSPGAEWTRPEPLLLLAESLRRLDRRGDAAAALRQALPLLSQDQRRRIEALIRQLQR
jgi:tetratricopeptide (TPR) repeat protein